MKALLIMMGRAFLAIVLLTSAVLAETSAPIYKDGDFWVFKIDRQSTAVSNSKFIQGLYTIRFKDGKFLMEASDVQYFSDTVPSVYGLTENPPWLRFSLDAGKKWTYQFRYLSEDRRFYSVNSEFVVVGPETASIALGTFEAIKVIRSDVGARAGKIVQTYFYSPKTGSVIKVITEFKAAQLSRRS
jgi:hypothetical protein